MPESPIPPLDLNSLLKSTFAPGENGDLGKDHKGNFVLADIDGSGSFHLENPHPQDSIAEIDGRTTVAQNPTGTFREYFRLTSPNPHQATITVNLDHNLNPESKTTLIDRFAIDDLQALEERNWQVQNISERRRLTSTFPNGTSMTAAKASHLNRASWTITTPKNHKGLVLRKVFDRFHGRQRARVLINDQPVGWWSDPWQNRIHRWAVFNFFIDPTHVPKDAEFKVTIDPPAGVPLWDVASYEVHAVLP